MLPRHRILLAYLLVLSLGAGLSAEIYWAGDRSWDLTQTLFDKNLPRLREIGEIRIEVLEHERTLYEYYATTQSERARRRIRESRARFQAAFQPLREAFPDSADIAVLEHYSNQVSKYTEQFDETMTADRIDWDRAREQLAVISDLSRAVDSALGNLVNKLQQQAYTTLEKSRRSSQITTLLVITFCVIIVIVAGLVGYFIDRYISEAAERKRLAMFAERNPDPVISTDWQGSINYRNPATERLLHACELTAEHIDQLLPANFQALIKELYQSRRETVDVEYGVGARFISCNVHLLEDLRLCHLHLRDITDKKLAEQRLQFLAYNDTLTSLPNRRSFDRDLKQRIEGEAAFAVALISIDRFQLVTASNGYKVGDQLLVDAAARIQAALHQQAPDHHAALYRFDGSHFAAVIEQHIDDDALRELSRRLARHFEPALEIESLCLYLSLSVGFSRYPEHGRDNNTLIKNADAALTRVMGQGGDNFYIYCNDIAAKEQAWMALETDLRNAVDQNELTLYYQPQISTDGQRLVGLEALLRWHQAAGSLVPPDVFIPIAEQTGLIVKMGEWILRTACRQAVQWCDAGLKNFVVAVNISPRQFQHHDFIDTVARVLQETAVDPGTIELEITEGLIMENVEASIDTLHRLKAMGLTLAIDDFGTGYSSLSYLKRFPIDKLKIDRSFVRNLERDTDDMAIVCTIIDLAHHLGLRVIAEGVETEAQRTLLQQHHCEEIQGYLIARPAPPGDLVSFIDAIRHSANAAVSNNK